MSSRTGASPSPPFSPHSAPSYISPSCSDFAFEVQLRELSGWVSWGRQKVANGPKPDVLLRGSSTSLKADFIFILSLCLSVCLCVGLYMWMQVPVKVRGAVSPGAGVTGSWEPPGVGAGSKLGSSVRTAHALSC